MSDSGRQIGDCHHGQQRIRCHQCLLAVIKRVHAAHADDICWMPQYTVDPIFEAAGLPVPVRTVGDPEAMLRNCRRFVREACVAGGGWRSYAEL